jgi:tricorn protease
MGSVTVIALATAMLGKQGATIEPRLLRQPDIHGSNVVFCYAGDLWVSTTENGSIARRLTSGIGAESRPHFSPDGKTVAFTATYDGSGNVFTIPVEGGEPKRLTYGNNDQCMGWTPDGKIMFATPEGNPYGGRQAQLMLVDTKGGLPQQTPIKEFSSGQYFADGKRVAYNRFNSFNFNWRRYRGGSQGKISIYNLATNEYSELPAKREQNYHPIVLGNSIYYISDRANGTLNLYKNENGKDTQLTNDSSSDIRFPETDGTTIVYERDGYLYHFNPATGKEVKLAPRILSENLGSRPSLKNLQPYVSNFSISPSGNRIAVEARGELFSLPAKTGETRNMTRSSGVREMTPIWSPDGKNIAYISDASGDREVYVQPQAGGTATQLTNKPGFRIENISWSPDSKFMLLYSPIAVYKLDGATKQIVEITNFANGGGSVDVSPDGKWIAYTQAGANANGAVWLYEVETGKKVKITEGFFNDSSLAFDRERPYLYFASDRTFEPTFGHFEFSLKVDNTTRMYAVALTKDAPNPFLDRNDEEPEQGAKPPEKLAGEKPADKPSIELDGIGNRIMVLPLGPGNYNAVTGLGNGFAFVSSGVLFQYNMGSKAPVPLYEGVSAFEFTPNRQKMAVLGRGGLQILPVQPGQQPGAGRVDMSNVEAVIDPKAEWKQIFWDVWRYERDHFYDASMGGQDWLAIGKKYEGYLQYVNHRGDLNYILGLLIGELATGHAYIQGQGDLGAGAPRVAVGNLCADFEVLGDGVRFAKILRGFNDEEQYQTPLGLPGIDVKDGEYLVAVDGNPVSADVNPSQFLVGKVGKTVTLSVNSKPSMEGARKVRVKPIATDVPARYWDWVEGNRKKVAELSGGRIGYMHISNTAAEGSHDLVRGFYQQTDKDAVLVDERWNGGGYIQPWFVDTLARKKKAVIQPRYGNDQPEAPVIEGPMALLINGYAGSGGDFFPYMFRQAGRGPLIGKRTWGGLVGISGGYTTVDGGNITAPSFSIYNPETGEIIAENQGIDPDMDIDMRPDLVAKGEDPQLEAGVKYLLEQLAKMPPKKVRSRVPQVGKNGKINP